MGQNNEAVEQNQDAGKVEKRFIANMNKLTAIFKGDKKVLGKKPKVANDDISGIIEELLKERKAATIVDFKARCLKLLDLKVQFDREMSEEENKLKKIKETKMEEFSKEIEATFGLVENIEKLAAEYATTLTTVGGKPEGIAQIAQ